jgi:ribosome-associated toxin RatA of RatAB toxin-antitoxin module
MSDIKVSKNQIEGVFTTKKGLNEFMSIEMEYCMPPIQYTNVGWLSEIWQGRKKVSINGAS